MKIKKGKVIRLAGRGSFAPGQEDQLREVATDSEMDGMVERGLVIMDKPKAKPKPEPKAKKKATTKRRPKSGPKR